MRQALVESHRRSLPRSNMPVRLGAWLDQLANVSAAEHARELVVGSKPLRRCPRPVKGRFLLGDGGCRADPSRGDHLLCDESSLIAGSGQFERAEFDQLSPQTKVHVSGTHCLRKLRKSAVELSGHQPELGQDVFISAAVRKPLQSEPHHTIFILRHCLTPFVCLRSFVDGFYLNQSRVTLSKMLCCNMFRNIFESSHEEAAVDIHNRTGHVGGAG